ncbi:MAG: ankyrin repeat domain-containing protein [Lentisphaerae bacterium]|nr:ankyrin repeat domain-containing protein [Lentisphaerota bacterium]
MNITFRQIPILIAIAAATVALVAIINSFSRPKAIAQAVREQSLPRLASAVAAHPELINSPDKNGFTPLHWAVMDSQTNLAEFLLAHGAAVNARDRYGMTPLHKAAAFNGQNMAELLLKHGADPNAFATKYGVIQVAPLHLAAEAGFDDVIRVLLDHGAEINGPTRGQNRATPLHLAAAKGRSATVKMLLQAGAEVNPRDIKGQTPLHWALVAEQADCADILRLFGGTE